MGSQSVTDFSAARKARIRKAIRSGDAWSAGSEAIHAFTETGNFAQALESVSVKVAKELLSEFVNNFKVARSPQLVNQTFQKFGVDVDTVRPYSRLAEDLQKKFDERLAATSRKTDSAFAAKDALTRTVMEVLSATVPPSKEPTDASRQEAQRAFQHVRLEGLTRVFHRNAITSLVKASFEAARGSIPRARVERVVKEVRAQLADSIAKEIGGQPGWMLSAPAKAPEKGPKLPLKSLNKILKKRKGKGAKGKKGKDEA